MSDTSRKDFNWKDRCPNKADNDLVILEAIKMQIGRQKTCSMLSLPGTEFVFEKQMMKEFPDVHFKFAFCEKNKDNFRLLRNNLHMLNRFNCEVKQTSRRLKHIENPGFDVVYMDYTGTASWEKMNELDRFFRYIPKEMLFVVNFMTGRGQPESTYYLEELFDKSKETGPWKSVGLFEHLKETIGDQKHNGIYYRLNSILYSRYDSTISKLRPTPMETSIHHISEKAKVRKGNALEVKFGKKSIRVDEGAYRHLLSVGK